MQAKKTRIGPESPAAPVSARSSAALGSNPEGDPSWSPLTLRGHATSKVSHPSGDCNNNLTYVNGNREWSAISRTPVGDGYSKGGAGLVWPTPP
jgi:hypothetical protein